MIGYIALTLTTLYVAGSLWLCWCLFNAPEFPQDYDKEW